MDHIAFALAHPVFNPLDQMYQDHFWKPPGRFSIGLTVNIGLE